MQKQFLQKMALLPKHKVFTRRKPHRKLYFEEYSFTHVYIRHVPADTIEKGSQNLRVKPNLFNINKQFIYDTRCSKILYYLVVQQLLHKTINRNIINFSFLVFEKNDPRFISSLYFTSFIINFITKNDLNIKKLQNWSSDIGRNG